MSDPPEKTAATPNVVLLIDRVVFDRIGEVLRHLVVGLVDQATPLRLMSADARVERLTLGPVKAIVHEPLCWPFVRRRTQQLVETLAARPPGLVHALSCESVPAAVAIARAFEADLLVSVSSVADCDALAQYGSVPVTRVITASEPLLRRLSQRWPAEGRRIELIRPGVIAARRIACFAETYRVPCILCFTPFEPGGGAEELVQAAHLLRECGHEFMLFLTGAGRHEAALRATIRDCRLASRVTVLDRLGGVASAMQHADLFVRPGAATEIAEDSLQAMGVGMAVASCPDDVSDHLHHEETAVVTESQAPEALAAGLERLLTDRSFARRIAATAMEYVRRHHSASMMAERAANLYRELALARTTLSLKE